MTTDDDNAADELDALSDERNMIRGKVVAFVNDREFVMNVGKADGVKVGMRFAVLKRGGVEVRDDDGELLGTMEAAKTVVKVVRVEGDHLSVGRTFLVIRGRAAIEGQSPMDYLRSQASFTAMLSQDLPAVPDRVETFKVERKDTLNDFDMNVQKGDEVRLTTSDEFIFPEWARG
ncbi:hypothetical protein [Mycobacterium sp. SMC-14]|uniref:hypothetical protein n=1 Tax=Mycobacterium sp. SMC-14 TaxID=3385968 RepID=UPI00390CB06E